jgi:16S rRNA (uracil1498-N3)-methyltransferase
MRNYRFTISSEDRILNNENLVEINNPKLIHQITNVLRLKAAAPEEISFIDGSGLVVLSQIQKIEKHKLIFQILSISQSPRELDTKFKFLVPIIKPEAFYFMIQKLTELGVQEFQPIFYQHSQEPYLKSFLKQKNKIQTIITEATEQSQGAKFAQLHDVIKLNELKDLSPSSIKVFAYEALAGTNNEKNLGTLAEKCSEIVLAVGPEGGLTSEEAEFLKAQGFLAYSLGKRLLKAETAAISLFSKIA